MKIIFVVGFLICACACAAAQTLEHRSGSNRGLNQFVMYAGFSVFK